MKTWRVFVELTGTDTVEVEATDEEDAIDKAQAAFEKQDPDTMSDDRFDDGVEFTHAEEVD